MKESSFAAGRKTVNKSQDRAPLLLKHIELVGSQTLKLMGSTKLFRLIVGLRTACHIKSRKIETNGPVLNLEYFPIHRWVPDVSGLLPKRQDLTGCPWGLD